MIVNKKGMSAIVITVILLALVLVAVGIVWAVVNDVIGGATDDIGSEAKCIGLSVRATSVDCEDPAACVVALDKTGDKVITGVKLVFEEADGTRSTSAIDEEGDVDSLAGKSVTVDSGLTAPVKVEVTPYFEDASGNDGNCQTSTTSF